MGPPGIQAIVEVSSTPIPVPGGGVGGGILPCPADTTAISGGFYFDGFGEVFVSRRQGAGWQAAAENFGSTDATLTIHAYCSPDVIVIQSRSAQPLGGIIEGRRAGRGSQQLP